jgi:hypothetical protein
VGRRLRNWAKKSKKFMFRALYYPLFPGIFVGIFLSAVDYSSKKLKKLGAR